MSGGVRWLLAAVMLSLSATCSASAEDPTPLPVREIAEGVFVYEAPYALASPRNEGAIANTGFIIGRDCVAVIDTEGSYLAGRRLLAAIKARTALPVRYVVNTHVHPDHVLGNAAFVQDGVTFVGHENLAEALAARSAQYLAATRELVGSDAFAGTQIVLPTLRVNGRLELELGNRRLIVESWPTAHTNSDLTVFDVNTATWFLGDLLFAGHIPALDGKLKGWIRVLQALAAREAARVVPGHGPSSLPWPEGARPIMRYLEGLTRDIQQMVQDGRTIQEAAAQAGRAEAERWTLFDEFNSRNATTAFQELEWE